MRVDANWQTPEVERPPGRPPMDRHGQIASQLQASKYDPATLQAGASTAFTPGSGRRLGPGVARRSCQFAGNVRPTEDRTDRARRQGRHRCGQDHEVERAGPVLDVEEVEVAVGLER